MRLDSLPEAWMWYRDTHWLVTMVHRLGALYWNKLPWKDGLESDENFVDVEGPLVVEMADSSLGHLNDLAILVLFSVFEAEVRETLTANVNEEVLKLRHVLL